MSNTMAGLRRQIKSAGELQSVVRTMKALAASSIGQYEKATRALAGYARSVELGLSACLRNHEKALLREEMDRETDAEATGAIVFGSDQGLVGQFNEVVAEHAIKTLAALPGKPRVWAVGERVQARLAEAGLQRMGLFAVPNSVEAITALVGEVQIKSEARRDRGEYAQVYVFHNRPLGGSLYEPVSQRLLPLDRLWLKTLTAIPWPTKSLPEVMPGLGATLRVLVREYLFISLFRACAESLASENASRLAAMERAEKNINELKDNLHGAFHRLRQSGIDDELFEVIAGFEALTGEPGGGLGRRSGSKALLPGA